MTSNPDKRANQPRSSLSILVTLSCWVIGVALHLLFQYVMGNWYDGMVYMFGFSIAATTFALTFAVSIMFALLVESIFRNLATLTRCLIHLAVGFVVVPVSLIVALLLLKPGLTTIQIGTVVALEVFFAVVVWSVTLITYGFAYERLRRRGRGL